MTVREDCRHYVQRTVSSGEVLRRCRLGANVEDPFDCPDGCLFFEQRAVMGAGWVQEPRERMSNTADGLTGLPPPKKRRRPKRR